MAESPRTAQNVGYIMRDAEDIRDYLKTLVDRENGIESKNTQRDVLIAIYRLTSAVESLHSTCRSIHTELVRNLARNDGEQLPPADRMAQEGSFLDQRSLLHLTANGENDVAE